MILSGLTVAWSGCGRGDNKTAIQAAIEAHLRQQPGLTLSNMTTEIDDVKIDGDKATAQATFQSKQNPELKVEVNYELRREGGHWEVASSTPMGGSGPNPHSGAGTGSTASAPGAGEGTAQSVPATPTGPPALQPSH